MDAICLKSLRKNPDERYRTVGEFADDLLRFFGGTLGLAKVGSGRWNASFSYRCGVSDVAFSPDEFIASTHTGFKRYDSRTGTMIQEVSFFDPRNEAEATYSIGIDTKGRLAGFSGGADGELVVWDFELQREVYRTTQAKRITEIAFSPDGLWMAHCGTDHTVRVTSVNDWKIR